MNMNRFALFSLITAFALVLIGAGINQGFQPSSYSKAIIDGTRTFANSQVDTLKYTRPSGLAGAAFSVAFGDSFSVTNVIMRRVVNNEVLAVVAGDTLVGAVAGTAAGARVATITLAPLVDEYRFFVTYAGSANGFTTPTVNYAIQQQFYTR